MLKIYRLTSCALIQIKHINFKTPKPATVSAAVNRREDNTILERKGHKDKYDPHSPIQKAKYWTTPTLQKTSLYSK